MRRVEELLKNQQEQKLELGGTLVQELNAALVTLGCEELLVNTVVEKVEDTSKIKALECINRELKLQLKDANDKIAKLEKELNDVKFNAKSEVKEDKKEVIKKEVIKKEVKSEILSDDAIILKAFNSVKYTCNINTDCSNADVVSKDGCEGNCHLSCDKALDCAKDILDGNLYQSGCICFGCSGHKVVSEVKDNKKEEVKDNTEDKVVAFDYIDKVNANKKINGQIVISGKGYNFYASQLMEYPVLYGCKSLDVLVVAKSLINRAITNFYGGNFTNGSYDKNRFDYSMLGDGTFIYMNKDGICKGYMDGYAFVWDFKHTYPTIKTCAKVFSGTYRAAHKKGVITERGFKIAKLCELHKVNVEKAIAESIINQNINKEVEQANDYVPASQEEADACMMD